MGAEPEADVSSKNFRLADLGDIRSLGDAEKEEDLGTAEPETDKRLSEAGEITDGVEKDDVISADVTGWVGVLLAEMLVGWGGCGVGGERGALSTERLFMKVTGLLGLWGDCPEDMAEISSLPAWVRGGVNLWWGMTKLGGGSGSPDFLDGSVLKETGGDNSPVSGVVAREV